MTNYLLSGVLTIGIWGIGAAYIRWFGSNDTMDYIAWLKIWAITAGFVAFGFSMLLGAVFPDPAMEEMLKAVSGITPESIPSVPDITSIPTLPNQ